MRLRVIALACLASGCTQTLDAGHRKDAGPSKAPDPCAMGDAGPSACTPAGLLDNLIGYWRLDDAMGSTLAFDSSGRGNTGVLRALDPNTAWVAGRELGALELAHLGWVQVAQSPSINAITDRITLSLWVDLEDAISASDGYATALSRQIGTTNYQHYHLALHMEGVPSLFLITDDGFAVIRAPDPVPRGVWTHLAGVYDGAVARLYVNGTEMVSQALTGPFGLDTTPVILGGNGNDASGVPNELVPGRIDELMLYARALSPSEIGQLAAGALFAVGARDAGAR